MAIRTNSEFLRQLKEQDSFLYEMTAAIVEHKLSILKAKMIQYYRDLEDGSATIPDFMRKGETPEDLADEEIKNLLARDDKGRKFNSLYETAYKELAEVLD